MVSGFRCQVSARLLVAEWTSLIEKDSNERTTSNVQHRTLNVDFALRGVGATSPTSRRFTDLI